jgi:hypothetical protein
MAGMIAGDTAGKNHADFARQICVSKDTVL